MHLHIHICSTFVCISNALIFFLFAFVIIQLRTKSSLASLSSRIALFLPLCVCVNARRGCVSCVKIAGVLGAPLDKRRRQRRRRRRFYSKKMLLYAF